MLLSFLSAVALAPTLVLPVGAATHSYATPPSYWGQASAPRHPRFHARHHRFRRHPKPVRPSVRPEPTDVLRLRSDVDKLRRELDGIKEELRNTTAPLPSAPRPLSERDNFEGGIPGALAVLTGFPDLRLPTQTPSLPFPPPTSSVELIDAVDRVRSSREYLISTATPGYTMTRLTPEVAIGRLHPAFAVKLAAAIRQARREGLVHCGVFSAYRPPIFGVGGFSDKFNSLHSYGLAVDVTGIGRPGSREAHHWQKVVEANGLYLPYGPDNHVEWNHTQFESTKVATARMRKTITASAPKSLPEMWLASGINDFVEAAKTIITTSAKLLPDVNWGDATAK